MRIDVADGSIAFAGGTIRGTTQRTEFLRSAMGGDAREQVSNEPEDWRQVAIDPEPGVAATLIFQGEKLHQVYLALRLAQTMRNRGRSRSSSERKARHDAWLESALGTPPYRYSWGSVSLGVRPEGPRE